MTFAIREARLEDAPAIARVHVDAFRATYRGIMLDAFLDGLSVAEFEKRRREGMTTKPDQFSFVAEEGSILGFAVGGPERSGDAEYRGELYAIYVRADQQRRGIGRSLADAVVGRLRERGFDSMLIWVLRDNPWQRFYEKLRGAPVRTRDYAIGGVSLAHVGYGWKDLKAYVASSPAN